MLRESLPLGDSCAECKRWRLVGAGCRSRRSRDGIAVLAFDVSAAIAVRGARVTSAALAANVHVTGYLVCKEMRLLAIAWATRRSFAMIVMVHSTLRNVLSNYGDGVVVTWRGMRAGITGEAVDGLADSRLSKLSPSACITTRCGVLGGSHEEYSGRKGP
ncbi:hypothetical protein AC579_8366 [Pseudocercospora musae]|uniref:Uncharacterized protein n=1 Tax=Pseudocercospora musae TaxID=113226 RepID=A0A139IIN2_9PEZI|nr:hypothetical protein AC579_8366 [Pseudocercospora musae]